MKRLIVFLAVIFSLAFSAGTTPQNVYIYGYEVMNEVTVNVTTTPVLVSMNFITTWGYGNVADYVEIYPQTQGISDLWYAVGMSTSNVTVWKPVGGLYSSTNN
jgi:hypothetical protein